MKEILPDQGGRLDRVEIHARKQQEYRLLLQANLRPGMKMYQYDPETKEITEVKLDRKVVVDLDGKSHGINKAVYDSKMLYVPAINARNAMRKIQAAIERTRKNQRP